MKVLIALVEVLKTKKDATYFRYELINEDKNVITAVQFEDLPDPEEVKGKVCDVTLDQPSEENLKPKVTCLKLLPDEDPTKFYKFTKLDRKAVLTYLKEMTRDYGILTQIVDHIAFNPKILKRFANWPAARNMHHAFGGGLLEHTYAMAKNAESVIANDPAYVGVSKGVVMSSIILHDMGKIMEYDWVPPGPATSNPRYALLGHMTIIDELITQFCREKGVSTHRGDVLNLRHCILSHHGSHEWGSPVTPGTREASLVHYLDLLQARGEMAKEIVESIGTRDSAYSTGLKSNFYNPAKINETE